MRHLRRFKYKNKPEFIQGSIVIRPKRRNVFVSILEANMLQFKNSAGIRYKGPKRRTLLARRVAVNDSLKYALSFSSIDIYLPHPRKNRQILKRFLKTSSLRYLILARNVPHTFLKLRKEKRK